MKNGAVIMSFLDILQKIGNGFGSLLSVELQGDGAMVGNVQFDEMFAHGVDFMILAD